MEAPLLPKPALATAGTASSANRSLVETCRIFVYPFASAGRIRPLGVRRKAPEFLRGSNGAVETDAWQQAWDQIDQAVGDNSQFTNRALLQAFLVMVVLLLGLPLAGYMQQFTCVYVYNLGLCPTVDDDIMEHPVLAFFFGFLYEIGMMYYFFLPRILDSLRKRDKLLRSLACKVRYVCDDVNNNNEGRMYLLARPNCELGLITVDVYKSKPPEEPKIASTLKKPTPSRGASDDSSPVIEAV